MKNLIKFFLKIIRSYTLKFQSDLQKLVWILRFGERIKIGRNVTIYGKMHITLMENSRLIIGNNVIFRNKTIYNFVGISKESSIYVNSNAKLEIGENSGFSGVSIYCVNGIKIGKHCNIGGNVSIWDTDFHPLNWELRRRTTDETKTAPIMIGDDVFIGAHCLILKGVSIGDRSILGAGSVLTKNIEPDSIYAGNPAKFIRMV